MNPTVNRSDEAPKRDRASEAMSEVRPSQSAETNMSPSTNSTPSADAEIIAQVSARNHPIPPPSDPKQYRAIGLIRGYYQPAEDILTRGMLKTIDGTEIQAVLLGRTISLIKNHLDLAQPHLWVVYPRTRQTGEDLHVQITGVWEPEVLGPKTPSAPESEVTSETVAATPPPAIAPTEPDEAVLPIRNGYFSVRGEAIFYAADEGKVVIKIQQSPRRESEPGKYFKIALVGALPNDNPLRHFWDIRALLRGTVLTIEEATDIGPMPPKKRPKGKFAHQKRGGRGGSYRRSSGTGNSEKPRKASSGSPTPTKRSQPPNTD
jgi:hypothetical protein